MRCDSMLMRVLIAVPLFFTCSTGIAAAAHITHGPMVGHTTAESTRIWVRADGAAELQVRLSSTDGQKILSRVVTLQQEKNYCATVVVSGLTPVTEYRYTLLLDGVEQPVRYNQSVTTFAASGRPRRLRIGFGHSIRGPGDQITWRAIDSKKFDLFILMGDNVYSNTTQTAAHRNAYLKARSDPSFSAFAAHTPIYAIWDDHDYGKDNSDRTQPGREQSLKVFRELWPNPRPQTNGRPGIWTRFAIGQAEFFLLDVRYDRSPDNDPDGPSKSMLGLAQRQWLLESLRDSSGKFKFLVSGSSWNCGGVESWNHRFRYEYDLILAALRRDRVTGVVLLGGDQHECKIGVRPAETWHGYDLHEWMAGQIWNRDRARARRGFGMITLDTTVAPAKAALEFFDQNGIARAGKRILYTPPGALRTLLSSSPGASASPGTKVPRAADGELRSNSGPLWDAMPSTTGEVLTTKQLRFFNNGGDHDALSSETGNQAFVRH